MSRKAKYSKEVKITACRKYLLGKGSYGTIAAEIGTNKEIVRRWVIKYQNKGASSFEEKKNNSSYSIEFKMNIIKECYDDSLNYIALKHGISPSVVSGWISKYNKGEIKEYKPCPGVYFMKSREVSLEEKIKIVKWVIKNEYNYKEAAEQFVIPYNQVYQWTKKYLKFGEEVLKDSRGRPSKNVVKELTELEKKDLEIVKLQAEVEHHKRAEEILKKNLEIRQKLLQDSLKAKN